MLEVRSRPDVHVHARDVEIVPGSKREYLGELLVPDSVLGVVAACVCLLAVAVTEARVDAQGDLAARPALAELVDHIGGSHVHMKPRFDSQGQGFFVEDIRCVNDRRRVAVRFKARSERALDLAGAYGIDEHAVAAHEIEDRDVRAGFLRVADDIKVPQVLNSPDDRGGIVHEAWRAELARQLADRNAGNFVSQGGKFFGFG